MRKTWVGTGCYLRYTFLFAIMALVVYAPFWMNGKSFVWNGDGLMQHILAMAYTGQWGREIIKTILFDHKLIIPIWDFSISQGADILTTLQYYGFTDPLVWISVFVPVKYTVVLYDVLIIVRLYLSGLFFVVLCRYKKKEDTASIIGALAYSFCGFALYAGVRHPFFLVPMVFLPLLIMGSEQIFNQEAPTVFIWALFFAIISNFYFSYMLCMIVIVYVAIRFVTTYGIKDGRKLLVYFRRFLISGLIGLALSAVVLLPMILCFAQSTRVGASHTYTWTYSRAFYESYFSGFMGYDDAGYWTVTGFIPLTFLSTLLLFSQKKKNTTLKVLFIVLLIMQMFPIFGHIMNGFSYMSNRWNWAFAALVSYILVEMWPVFREAGSIHKRRIVVLCVTYVLICFFVNKGRNTSDLQQQAMLLILVLLLFLDELIKVKNKAYKEYVIMFLCLLSIYLNAHYLYSFKANNYVEGFIDRDKVYEKIMDLPGKEAKEYYPDQEFGRYTLYNSVTPNESILGHTFSAAYYWSVIGDRISEFEKEMAIGNAGHYRWNYRSRTFIDALSNVRYQVNADGKRKILPYGYERIDWSDRIQVYENQYALPIGYTYSSVLDEKKYRAMKAAERQEAIMQAVLLDPQIEGYQKDQYITTSRVIPYAFAEVGPNCIIDENGGILVKKNNTSVIVKFEEQAACELYLSFEGLKVEYMNALEVYQYDELGKEAFEALSKYDKNKLRYQSKYDSGVTSFNILASDHRYSVSLPYYTPADPAYAGNHDFIVNLGYVDEARNQIRITFPKTGYYSFDTMEIISQPMDNYPKYIADLKNESLEQVKLGNNELTGRISISVPKILCLAVPYSKGWTAYVDGIETPIMRANVWSMAIALKPGEHDIRLVYATPGMKEGCMISMVGIIAFAAMIIGHRKRKWFV